MTTKQRTLGKPIGRTAGRALRCTFVHCPDPVYADTQNYGAQFMPLWAYTLAAHIPKSGAYELRLHDTRTEPVSRIAEADVFLFSGINQDYGMITRTQAELRTRYAGAVFVIGGPICWSFDQAGEIGRLSMFDHVYIGDGEDEITPLLDAIAAGRPLDHVIRNPRRFEIGRALPVERELLARSIARYYGGIVEVSRGCPFLCEFCDIRVLPDNNRPHNKRAELIVEEVDHLSRRGVRQILLACDNFIGEPGWAEDVVDALLAWQQRSGFRPALYTWLTINLYKHPALMAKMRRAGFDMLFIGVESFNANALVETAKVQNSTAAIVDAVRTIQACGFIVVAGLIFGFDSDRADCFELTIDGLLESGLLSGDPSLLTALPGTPLYRRMKLAGRLRDVRYGLGGYKYQTNIRYLMPRRAIIDGYKRFVAKYNDGAYQYARLRAFFDLLDGDSFIPLERRGYGDLRLFARAILRNRAAALQLCQRLARFARRPANLWYALKGLAFAFGRRRIGGWLGYVQFWLFAWTNSVLKYESLSEEDFDIESVEAGFDIRLVLPEGYAATASEPIPRNKIEAQLRATTGQLATLIAGARAAE